MEIINSIGNYYLVCVVIASLISAIVLPNVLDGGVENIADVVLVGFVSFLVGAVFPLAIIIIILGCFEMTVRFAWRYICYLVMKDKLH